MKIYQVCRLVPDRKAAAASTVFVDRLSALAALLLLATVSLLFDPGPFALVPWSHVPTGRLLAIAAGCVIIGLLIICLFLRLKVLLQLRGRMNRTLYAASTALKWNRSLLTIVILAFSIHLINFLSIYLFARALGIPMSYGQVVRMMPVVLLLVLIPITINGHGLREVLFIAYFGYMGIAVSGFPVRESAVALSLLLVANDLLWSLPGGLFYLFTFSKPALTNEGQQTRDD